MAYRQDDATKACYEGTNAMPRQGADSRTLHVGVTEGDVAQRIVTCGTLERAQAVAAHFDGGLAAAREVRSARGFATLTGAVGGVPVSVIATGMGAPMMDFMCREALATLPRDAGALLVRFGTCGAVRDDVREGTVVVATGSTFVRREPDAFAREPAAAGGARPYSFCAPVAADPALADALARELAHEC